MGQICPLTCQRISFTILKGCLKKKIRYWVFNGGGASNSTLADSFHYLKPQTSGHTMSSRFGVKDVQRNNSKQPQYSPGKNCAAVMTKSLRQKNQGFSSTRDLMSYCEEHDRSAALLIDYNYKKTFQGLKKPLHHNIE